MINWPSPSWSWDALFGDKIGIRGIKTANNHSSAGEILLFLNVHYKGFSSSTSNGLSGGFHIHNTPVHKWKIKQYMETKRTKSRLYYQLLSPSHSWSTVGFRGLQMSFPYPLQYTGAVEGVSNIMSRSNSFNLTTSGAWKTSLFRQVSDKTQCLNKMWCISVSFEPVKNKAIPLPNSSFKIVFDYLFNLNINSAGASQLLVAVLLIPWLLSRSFTPGVSL